MKQKGKFDEKLRNRPFSGYEEYMDYIFACANLRLQDYIQGLKEKYANGQGNYKNALYPDIEVAYEQCDDNVQSFLQGRSQSAEIGESVDDAGAEAIGLSEDIDEELLSILRDFSSEDTVSEEDSGMAVDAEEILQFIDDRMAATKINPEEYPFYNLCQKLSFGHFTIFTLACAILASTQTSYAAVFQIVNENGSITTPTIESAARLYFGKKYSMTTAYGVMSVCLEQLLPVLDLRVNSQMPFSTLVALDKRLIDFLFGHNPFRLDENYKRFIKMLTDDVELNPIMANEQILEAMEISYDKGVRCFSFYGDEGSGRKFFVRVYGWSGRRTGYGGILLTGGAYGKKEKTNSQEGSPNDAAGLCFCPACCRWTGNTQYVSHPKAGHTGQLAAGGPCNSNQRGGNA